MSRTYQPKPPESLTPVEDAAQQNASPLALEESQLRIRRKKMADKAAAMVITGGGFAIILSIAAILWVIGAETYPLWKSPSAEWVGPPSQLKELASATSHTGVLALGIDEYREIAYTITGSGVVDFRSLPDQRPLQRHVIRALEGHSITSIDYQNLSHSAAIGTAAGVVVPIKISFLITYEGKTRVSTPQVIEGTPVVLDPGRGAITDLSYQYFDDEEEQMTVTGVLEERTLVFLQQKTTTSFLGDPETSQTRIELPSDLGAGVSALAMDPEQRNIFVALKNGEVLHWDIREPNAPLPVSQLRMAGRPAVRAMEWLIGGRSLVMGDDSGGLSVWFQVRDKVDPAKLPFREIHIMPKHQAAITAISASPRNKGFISGDSHGIIRVNYSTTETVTLSLTTTESPITYLAYAPRTDGMLALNQQAVLYNWYIHDPHPEITLSSLFNKVWYEGYDGPDLTWQSSSGTDDFEPKFSLTPLAYGTLKGTFYALLLAIPVSLCAALYTSQFMHPRLRGWVKPSVEVMAALPSVVLGFFAGLWLAPLVADMVPALLLMLLVLPVVVLSAAVVWRLLPLNFRNGMKPGIEIFVLMPLIILTIYLCILADNPIERAFFQGDFPQWLFDTTGVRYDPRNSLIVGFAMGFAVIPIIYTICEDAFSNVPQHLISGSLALGASRWQTALRVVLPTASPGVFSAIMIGFGRAVGETMIVLMATGNTPIMDFDPFTGFRALSANIAVEIPEAPHGGTLYRVLFLAALLLFISTFLVNTAAEIVRQRLRDRYGRI